MSMTPKEALRVFRMSIRQNVNDEQKKEYEECFEIFNTLIAKAEPKKEYIFHGTNGKMLDDFLVAGTFFTNDLEIAIKYGKTIYVIELNELSSKWFNQTDDGYYQSLGKIPLSYLIKLVFPNIAIKVKRVDLGHGHIEVLCPVCGEYQGFEYGVRKTYEYPYCAKCGIPLDWSDEK